MGVERENTTKETVKIWSLGRAIAHGVIELDTVGNVREGGG